MQEKNNEELEQLLASMGAQREKKDMDAVMRMLKETFLFVPAFFPENMTKEQIQQLMNSKKGQGGELSEIFKDAMPQPCLLEDAEKNKYLPVFTSKKQVATGPKYPMLMYLPFQVCVNMLIRLKDVKGISLNPFTNNIILNLGKTEINNTDSKGRQQLSPDQVPALIRQKVEGNDIPVRLHHDKAAFMQAVDERREAFLLEFYEENFKKNNLDCPYTLDDFEVMYLAISDELEVARITLPTKNLAPGMSKLLFFTRNLATNQVHFYALVKGIPTEKDFIGEILEDGKKVTIQDAPKEGNELTAILEILGREEE